MPRFASTFICWIISRLRAPGEGLASSACSVLPGEERRAELVDKRALRLEPGDLALAPVHRIAAAGAIFGVLGVGGVGPASARHLHQEIQLENLPRTSG